MTAISLELTHKILVFNSNYLANQNISCFKVFT